MRIDRQFQFARGIAQFPATEGSARAGQTVRAALQRSERFRWIFTIERLLPERANPSQLPRQGTPVVAAEQFQVGKK